MLNFHDKKKKIWGFVVHAYVKLPFQDPIVLEYIFVINYKAAKML